MSANSARRGKLMVWKVPQSTIQNWSRLDTQISKSQATDCVVNSLHLLGVLKNRAFSSAIAKQVNAKQTGLSDKEIIHFIYEYLNRKEGVYSEETKTTAGIYDGNIDDLNNGEYTFAIFRGLKFGHAVVIYKHENIVFVYDPQQERSCSETELENWIKEREFYQVDFLYFEKVARLRSKSKTNTKTKTKSNTRKKLRREFDKNVVFAMGTKGDTLKHRTKRTREFKKRTKKGNINSLLRQFEQLKIGN
jgi:hypothetical protein